MEARQLAFALVLLLLAYLCISGIRAYQRGWGVDDRRRFRNTVFVSLFLGFAIAAVTIYGPVALVLLFSAICVVSLAARLALAMTLLRMRSKRAGE